MKISEALFALAVCLFPLTTRAASSSQALQVHVPFTFMVAGEEFAPGDYRVQQNDNGIIFVQGQGKAVATLSSPCGLGKPGMPSSLQFSVNQQREYLVGVNLESGAFRTVPVHFMEAAKTNLAAAR